MNVKSNGHEHEFEPAYGLPEPLPKNERMLWQGAPDFGDLAIRVFHVRKAAIYFAVLIALRAIFLSYAGQGISDVAYGLMMPILLAGIALSALTILAWLTARTTAYTLTDQRIVMRVGIVLTLTFNLPLKRIKNAGLLLNKKGFGDIPLALNGGDRIGWLNLWPHARPWRLANPEPMLRSVANAQAFAAQLQTAWSAAAGKAVSPAVQLATSQSHWQANPT